jgi:hypothetical protein
MTVTHHILLLTYQRNVQFVIALRLQYCVQEHSKSIKAVPELLIKSRCAYNCLLTPAT